MDKNKPIIKKSFTKIKKSKLIDTYLEQLTDLFLLKNPQYRFIKDYQKPLADFIKKSDKGNWVFSLGWINMCTFFRKRFFNGSDW